MLEFQHKLKKEFLQHPKFEPILLEMFSSIQMRLDNIPDFVKQASFLFNLERELFERSKKRPFWEIHEAAIDAAMALVARYMIGYDHPSGRFDSLRTSSSAKLDARLRERGYPIEYSYLLTDFPEQHDWENNENPPMIEEYYSRVIPNQAETLSKIDQETKSIAADVLMVKVIDYADEEEWKEYVKVVKRSLSGLVGSISKILAYGKIRENPGKFIEARLKVYDKMLDDLIKLPPLPSITHPLYKTRSST